MRSPQIPARPLMAGKAPTHEVRVVARGQRTVVDPGSSAGCVGPGDRGFQASGSSFPPGMLGDHRADGAARLTLVNVVIKV